MFRSKGEFDFRNFQIWVEISTEISIADNLNMGESSKEADGGELVQVDLEKTENQDLDVEAKQEDKLKYPRSIWFIVVNEFCERWVFGLLSGLLKTQIKMSLFPATAISAWELF